MRKICRRIITMLIVIFLANILNISNINAQQAPIEESQVAGEFFGVPVSAGNYYFAKRVVMTFGAKWRGTPQDEKELEDLVWQELLFSYEAFQRGITADKQEVDEEIEKILEADKVDFSFRVDKEKYQKWVKDKLNIPVEAFENQMEHLVKLEKLRKQILESFDPIVSEEDAYNKFLNEYNTLMVELKQFDDKDKAEVFYEKASSPVSEKATDELIWNDLIYSYLAVQRNFKAPDSEVDKRILYLMRDDDVRFNWEKEPEKYRQWVKDKFNTEPADFRRYITCFATIDELMSQIASGEQPGIENKEKFEYFLDKNKKVSIAYNFFFHAFDNITPDVLQFESAAKAKKFYALAGRSAGFWEDQKRNDPKSFKVPGFVALDFLMHMWGFQKEDAYKMLEREIGSYYPPAPIYKGYGVFKIKKVRKADPADFENKKESYLNKVKTIKQYDLYKEWVEDFKEKAAIKVYLKE